MLFSKLQREKNSLFFSFITYILFFGFLLSISGCENTKVSRESPEYIELFSNSRVQASQIILKDGRFIDVTNNIVYYYKTYKDTTNVLVFITNFDTVKSSENGKEIKRLIPNERIIPLSNVQEVYVTRTEIDAGKTILLGLGVIAVSALIFLIVAFASFANSDHHSCPYVYSYDGEKYIYDAEPLGGAVCNGLSRTDYSRLDYLAPSDGYFKMLIRNENEEIQYLDEMKIVSVKHDENKLVSIGQDNEFYQFSKIYDPISVTDENNKDVTDYFIHKDKVKWQTVFPDDLSSSSLTKRQKLHFKFKKPENAGNAMLFVNGGTAQWGSDMVKKFLQLRGRDIDKWYESIYPGSDAQKELYSLMLNEELYYLKININYNGIYKHRATIKSGGPLIDEDVLINIPLTEISGDLIEFELYPPPGFWKFDRIGMVFDYEKIKNSDIQTLSTVNAIDDKNQSIKEKLSAADKNYYNMERVGSSCDLSFRVPADYNSKEVALFFKTTGWYEIVLDKTKEPQNELLSSFLAKPLSVLNFSQKMLLQEYKKFSVEYYNLFH